jgi:hypothetical protein
MMMQFRSRADFVGQCSREASDRATEDSGK